MSNLGYYLTEGFKNLFKNKKSTISSIISMFFTLIIFGTFLLISDNTNQFINSFERSQGMQVFIADNTKQEDIKALGDEIGKIDGVNSVKFKSNQEALEDLKKMSKDNPDIIEGYADDPSFLPNSYIVMFTDLSKANDVKKKIENLQNVSSVKDQEGIISTILAISKGAKIITGGITIMLVIFSVTIIANTIRLTVEKREREISIMKYVGATNTFIKGPFVVEGTFIGFVATIFAIITLSGLYEFVISKVSDIFTTTSKSIAGADISISLVPFAQVLPTITVTFLLLSIGLGVVGSMLSMKKYLNV